MNTRFKVLSEGKSLIESFATFCAGRFGLRFFCLAAGKGCRRAPFWRNRSVIDRPTEYAGDDAGEVTRVTEQVLFECYSSGTVPARPPERFEEAAQEAAWLVPRWRFGVVELERLDGDR